MAAMPLVEREQQTREGRGAYVEAMEARIRAQDPHWRAFADWRPLPRGHATPTPPFLITYKDTIDVPGFATRMGSLSGYRQYPVTPARVVTLLDSECFICIGKVATTEFSLGTRIPCRNPTFPDIDPGGSSTGCGVAVAAELCDVSIGTDTAGSTGWPAVNCGAVGLRLTYDPALLEGVFPVAPRMDSLAIAARSVSDLAFVWERGGLARLVGDERGFPRRSSDRLTVGRVTNWETMDIHPDVRSAVDDIVEALVDAHVAVQPVSLDWWHYRPAAWSLLLREAWDLHRVFMARVEIEYDVSTWNTLLLGRDVTDCDYEALKRDHARATARAHEDLTQGRVDVLLLPLSAHPPRRLPAPPLATSVPPEPGFRILAGFTGTPALALPVRRSGAPIGVQLMARPGGEADLIAVGRLIETRLRGRPFTDAAIPVDAD